MDKYDSGDLVINGKSTKEFSDSNWDSYRNNCVEFIFQSYIICFPKTIKFLPISAEKFARIIDKHLKK